jgi:hypothetical protein
VRKKRKRTRPFPQPIPASQLQLTPRPQADFSSIASSLTTTPPSPTPDRTLVTYAFHDTPNARANLAFFLRHGLHPDADFVFILNGETDVDATMIPRNASNVRVVRRANTCFDLGAHGEVLLADGGLWTRYARFVTLNASVRGPFLPYWAARGVRWTDLFLAKVTDETKVGGSGALLARSLEPFFFFLF